MKRILCKYFIKTKKYTSDSVVRHQSTHHFWTTGDGKTPKQLKIAAWNVNGIRSVISKGTLTEFLELYDPDIITFNQTKMDLIIYEKQAAQIKDLMPNYYQSWNFCKVSSGYSGVAAFTKYKPISYEEDIPESNEHNFQGRSLTLQFQHFFLITCYKPSSGNKLERLEYRVNDYDPAFQDYLEKLKKKKPIIVCGDLNVAHRDIDLAYPKKNLQNAGFTKEQKQSFQNLLNIGLLDSFRYLYPHKIQYTYWSYQRDSRPRNIGWRLDYVLVDSRLNIKQAQIYDEIEGSDHCPISAQIQVF